MRFSSNNRKVLETFYKNFYYLVSLLLFSILILRLFQLQIIHGKRYFVQSEKNRIRAITLKPLRGRIFDRNGEMLVGNQPAYSVYATPYELQSWQGIYTHLANILKIPEDELKTIVKKHQQGKFNPVKLKRQVNFETLSRINEERLDLPGVGFWIESKRFYPSSARVAHVLGYLGEVSPDELEKFKGEGYRYGDVIGKQGVERQYEKLLRGQFGYEFVEVDALGREVRKVEEQKPIAPKPGMDLYLTIDVDIQTLAESLLGSRKGSLVLLNVRNGEVLCLVSKPDFDPSVFAGIITEKQWDYFQNHPNHPLYNRAIQSTYPPGSTYKLVLAIAALESGVITPEWSISCSGRFRFGARNFKCWKSKGHGVVNLYQAIEQSCNVYFYQLSLKTGLSRWADFGRKLGFGRKTGIDIGMESEGVVPDEAYLDSHYGKGQWTEGMLLNLAVGQGDLLVTPLQMAQLAMILANYGKYFRPHVVKRIYEPVTRKEIPIKVDSSQVQGVSHRVYEIVRQGMWLVVNGASGTGRAAALQDIAVAGKTGTAQNPHGDDHAWFIGFAPFDFPRVAIVVMVENGGSGGAVAAPIARQILQEYFRKYPVKLPEKMAISLPVE